MKVGDSHYATDADLAREGHEIIYLPKEEGN